MSEELYGRTRFDQDYRRQAEEYEDLFGVPGHSVARADEWDDSYDSIEEIEDADDVATTDTTLEHERVEIEATTDEAVVNNEVVTAISRHPAVYRKAGVLVHVVEGDDNTPSLQPMNEAVVRHRIAEVASFVAEVESRSGTTRKPVHVPAHAVKYVHNAGNWPNVRRIRSVLPHPIILPDGSIVTANGYEPTTQYYVHLPAGLRVVVPDRPTQAEVKEAATKLLDLVVDFPFEGEAHKSAWLAGLLTPLCAGLYDGCAPVFLIEANRSRVGKGKLANITANITFGREFECGTYPDKDTAEMRKLVTAVAIGGDRCYMFDNVEGNFGDKVLDAAVTTKWWTDRVLGVSARFGGPLDVLWYATGNNVAVRW